jgi:hypothetical protein
MQLVHDLPSAIYRYRSEKEERARSAACWRILAACWRNLAPISAGKPA